MGIKLERPELPFVPEPDVSLYDVVVANLHEDVVPSLPEAFARNRAETAALLVAALDREHRIGPTIAEIELDELAELLGRYPADLARVLPNWIEPLRRGLSIEKSSCCAISHGAPGGPSSCCDPS